MRLKKRLALFSRKPKKSGAGAITEDAEDTSGTAEPEDFAPHAHTAHAHQHAPQEIVTTPMDLGADDDDISTLAEPAARTGVMSWDSYNKLQSTTTAGDVSISSAGLTLSAGTLGVDGDTIGTSTVLRSMVSDDSFTFDPSLRSLRPEEVLFITAPPGKLGMSLDAPDNGAPYVHSIKDTSPLHGRLRPGDRLVAVDGEDVRYLTAIKISKILGRKSDRERVLTIVRTMEAGA